MATDITTRAKQVMGEQAFAILQLQTVNETLGEENSALKAEVESLKAKNMEVTEQLLNLLPKDSKEAKALRAEASLRAEAKPISSIANGKDLTHKDTLHKDTSH